METRRLSTKHKSKMNSRGQVTKLSQDLIESFAMTSPTSLKTHQLKVSNMFKIPLNLVCVIFARFKKKCNNVSRLKRSQF